MQCNFCGLGDYDELFVKGGCHIVKCRHCGLVFLNASPSSGSLPQVYTEDFFTDKGREQYFIHDRQTNYLNTRKKIKLVKNYIVPSKILDVGCAFGFFVRAAQEQGWESWGNDISGFAVKHLQNDSSIKTLVGDFQESNLPKGYFDAITMWDYIEHAIDPLGNLKKANSSLRNGGMVFISTGDVGSLFARCMGKRWRLIKPKYHLYYFSKKTLSGMLKKAGFKVCGLHRMGRFFNVTYLLHTSEDTWRNAIFNACSKRLLQFNNKYRIFPERVYLNFRDILTVVARKI